MTRFSRLGLLIGAVALIIGVISLTSDNDSPSALTGDPPGPATFGSQASASPPETSHDRNPIGSFLALTTPLTPSAEKNQILERIGERWSDDDTVMMLEAARFASRTTRDAIYSALQENTGQTIRRNLGAWYRWTWNREDFEPHPEYAEFKRRLYAHIDPRFAEYFSVDYPTTIRLDEVRWGGVRRDGIPPLKNPHTTDARDAKFLADTDVVFGVKIGDHARAYPKRILAWHEMVKDVVGGRSINGVYCTLCGSMIVYDTKIARKHYELGTSGFLYRSNKLMYDHKTKSMWSTIRGEPVIGTLVGKGLKLEPLYVVTTTWGKWRSLHPETDVLSLETGHRRDYSEGAAYRAYFATDDLMFDVPLIDERLKNKQEVLVIRGDDSDPVAIDTEFLRKNRVHHESIGDRNYVVITDASGANRVYETHEQKFESLAPPSGVLGTGGGVWEITESALISPKYEPLNRAPAHRAFWFGWHAAHPNTRLVADSQP